MKAKHPIQPVVMKRGAVRFKENAIVSYLLDFAQGKGCGLNELAVMKFSKEDRQQFAQLIGYSVYGYCELSYVDAKAEQAADALVVEFLK